MVLYCHLRLLVIFANHSLEDVTVMVILYHTTPLPILYNKYICLCIHIYQYRYRESDIK